MAATEDKQILGTIHIVFETNMISNSFRKREVIVRTEGQHPQLIKIEFTQDRVDVLNHYKRGDIVRIDINLRGREWIDPSGKTVYFNSIQGWKITRLDDSGRRQPNIENGSPHVQHNMRFPPANEVFGDTNNYQPTRQPAQQPTFTQKNYDLNYDDDNDDLPF